MYVVCIRSRKKTTTCEPIPTATVLANKETSKRLCNLLRPEDGRKRLNEHGDLGGVLFQAQLCLTEGKHVLKNFCFYARVHLRHIEKRSRTTVLQVATVLKQVYTNIEQRGRHGHNVQGRSMHLLHVQAVHTHHRCCYSRPNCVAFNGTALIFLFFFGRKLSSHGFISVMVTVHNVLGRRCHGVLQIYHAGIGT